jgi:hypothetical protein
MLFLGLIEKCCALSTGDQLAPALWNLGLFRLASGIVLPASEIPRPKVFNVEMA